MRFVLAIVAFVLAAVMIMLGIAQRTVFLEPASTSLSATVEGGVKYAVIDSKALTAFPGSQTITVTGSGKVFVAYGRSADVKAWLGGDPYDQIGHAAGASALTSKFIEATAQPAPDSAAGGTPVVVNPDPAGTLIVVDSRRSAVSSPSQRSDPAGSGFTTTGVPPAAESGAGCAVASMNLLVRADAPAAWPIWS